MKFAARYLILFFICIPLQAFFPENPKEEILNRMAFGSCYHQDRGPFNWASTGSPDLWVWMGDNYYGDSEDPDIMRGIMEKVFLEPGYQEFREQTMVVGTWDDHDFGLNNGGSWFPAKESNRQILLDFLEIPDDHPLRQQEGMFQVMDFGTHPRQVRVILLDGRTFADRPGPEASLLGENQWEKLERALKRNPATWTFIVSGIQILPVDQPFESWARFPAERTRLLELIRYTGTSGFLFLSGDRHIHEFHVLNDDITPYPLWELTTSGMSHSFSSLAAESNRFRVGSFYSGLGSGRVDFHWEEDPAITLSLISATGNVVKSLRLEHWMLQPEKDREMEGVLIDRGKGNYDRIPAKQP